MKHKIVLNKTYGGFEISAFIFKKYYEIKYPSKKLYFYNSVKEFYGKHKYKKIESEDDFNKVTIALTTDLGSEISIHTSIVEYLPKNFERTDKLFIELVEKYGTEKSSTLFSHLVVEEFEGDKYKIQNYDGLESVMTPETIKWEIYYEN